MKQTGQKTFHLFRHCTDHKQKMPPSAWHGKDAAKKALWGALEHGLTDACKAGAQHLVSMWGHPDQNEGPMAFAEKRDPNWKPLS